MTSHSGRVAVVTGAASGFGRAIAVELARRGADIVAVDLQPGDETAAAITDLGRAVLNLQADVSQPDQVAGIGREMLSVFGRVDILVNNAGVFPFRDLFDLGFDEWKRTLEINLDSQFLMTKAVIDSMRQHGWGRIVNVASNSLGLTVGGLAHYMASKGGVIGLTRALANDLAPYGITVNAIEPAASSTPGGRRNIGDRLLTEVAAMQAIKRVGTASDITGAVCFLTGDDSAFITGQTIVVDGGLHRV
ncbi:short-chain dehydrogenase [Mycolicibacter heraklionensis]|uniref:Short-chain dehydrogenase n=1 Tax=Mycolicibacter heraklionensis TaxID=512402 RepID=A0ABR5FKG6_9MYCO|nr:SDR family NAD(P)-dependent oxidoreductase [Mycolicibacter heraklionensis]KLO31379.1 short-chain dehydrogenase [Mycolicibacter heraklionensis]